MSSYTERWYPFMSNSKYWERLHLQLQPKKKMKMKTISKILPSTKFENQLYKLEKQILKTIKKLLKTTTKDNWVHEMGDEETQYSVFEFNQGIPTEVYDEYDVIVGIWEDGETLEISTVGNDTENYSINQYSINIHLQILRILELNQRRKK